MTTIRKPMNLARLGLCWLLALGLLACGEGRTIGEDSTVVLSLTDFDGLPFQVSVNAAAANGAIQVEELTLSNFPADPRGSLTSELQSIELRTMEVTFTRVDTGSRVPPSRVRSIFGVVPINGTFVLENFEIMGPEQLLNPPLSDLLFENGAIDTETNAPFIALDVRIQFFGRTLGGEDVASAGDTFRIEFLP